MSYAATMSAASGAMVREKLAPGWLSSVSPHPGRAGAAFSAERMAEDAAAPRRRVALAETVRLPIEYTVPAVGPNMDEIRMQWKTLAAKEGFKLEKDKAADASSALIVAAYEGDERAVRECLQTADVNARDTNEWTALHQAASQGYLSIVKLLLEKGANARLRTQNNDTALDKAAQWGHDEVVAAINEKFPPPKKRNSKEKDEWGLDDF